MSQYFTVHELFIELIFPGMVTVLSVVLAFLLNLILEKYKKIKYKSKSQQNKINKSKEKFVNLKQKINEINKKNLTKLDNRGMLI